MNEILENNLASISVKSPDLADLLKQTKIDPLVVFKKSRNGCKIPVIKKMDGTEFRLHSEFDPEKEAKNIAINSSASGFLIFFGLGGGYLVKAFLEGNRCASALIIDFDIYRIRTILDSIDMSGIFSDPRVKLMIDPKETELKNYLLGNYLPVLFGDLSSIIHKPSFLLNEIKFLETSDMIKSIITLVSMDYSSQSCFGKRWFTNIIRNLPIAYNSTCSLPYINEAIITAAGPSLEDNLDEIKNRKSGSFLIATDTSWPFLFKQGIFPDVIVSMDCQHISYCHFFNDIPDTVPLVIDLASPNILASRAKQVIFYSSNHPLCRFISSHWCYFPSLDTNGGNVSHTCASLAISLGAKKLTFLGADFSYPMGKCYARGTYIYNNFEKRSCRLVPVESLFQDLVFRNQVLERISEDGGFRYETGQMSFYKSSLENFCQDKKIEIIFTRNYNSAPIQFHSRHDSGIVQYNDNIYSEKKNPDCPVSEFIKNYLDMVAGLPFPSGNLHDFLGSLSDIDRDVFSTILPVAASIKKMDNEKKHDWTELMADTIKWITGVLKSAIKK